MSSDMPSKEEEEAKRKVLEAISMIKGMTGYGSVEIQIRDRKVIQITKRVIEQL